MNYKRKRRYLFATIALFSVLTMGIVFAATNGLLTFNGTAVINPNAKVVFDSVQITNGSAQDSYTISPDGQTVDFTVYLEGQNDYVDVYCSLANTGNVTVVLNNFGSSGQPAGITATWPDNLNGQILSPGAGLTTDKIRIRLDDVTLGVGSYTLSASVSYQQM